MNNKKIFTIFSFITILLLLSGCGNKTTINETIKITNQKILINETIILKNNSNSAIKTIKNTTKTIKNTPIKKNNQTTQISINNSWYKPTPGTTWQWQLSGNIDTSFKVDLYDIDLINTPQSVIDELHKRDIKVICYFSAGSWEKFRNDANNFPPETIGKTMQGWPDEKWLDISNYQKFTDIMEKRLDLAVKKKCDGVEPDNIHAYQEESGFQLTYQDQLKYNIYLSNQAHKRNLSIALKYDIEQISDLINYFDFAINEQCFQYKECEKLTPFIKQNKAVFGVEYELKTKEFCPQANEMNFSWLETNYDLDGKSISCN